MKAIFPCLGSLIITKDDIEKLVEFYNSGQTQANDDLEIIAENNFLNYFVDNVELLLYNVTPLTISKLKNALGISSSLPNNSSQQEPAELNSDMEPETPISDDSIFSNPFFTTLKPVD